MANLETSILESEEKLKEAFNFYDTDQNGQISLAELRNVFTDNEEMDLINKLLKETDSNEDGQVFLNLDFF